MATRAWGVAIVSFYRQQLEDWLSGLDVSAKRVLDIGGAQGSVKGRTKSWGVGAYEILDLPEFDIETDEAEQVDLIFCLEVFEYLIRPLEALYNIEASLEPGGHAYVSFAFAYPHHNELELDALRYTEPGIKRLADEVGLKIESTIYRYDRSGHLEAFYRADGMHPARQYPDHSVTGFIVEFKK